MSHSRTAEFMALFRTLEHARGPRRLFADPYARRFLGRRLGAVGSVARLPGVADGLARLIDARWPGARSSGVARTRWIDERVTAAVRDGARQLVLLGAGFDCRAHRLPLDGVRVFEVDRAETQAHKRSAAPSGEVVYVPADLERVGVDEALADTGFDPALRSVVVWEGVTNYLTAEAIDTTFRALAGSCSAGSVLVFTYVHAGLLDGSFPAPERDRLFATLARSGEPWTFGLVPDDVPAWLAARGFEWVDDKGATDLRRAYGMPRADAGYTFYRTVTAVRR